MALYPIFYMWRKKMYSFKDRVRYSETDSEKRLTLMAILNYFQDCSTFQSEDLGVGMELLRSFGCLWVLNYWQIDVYEYPHLCDEITIGTRAYMHGGFLGHRNFYMEDKDGKRLAAANTLWTYLNAETGKPAHIPEEVSKAYGIDEKLDMDYEARKISFPKDAEVSELEPFRVEMWHLDANNHVNNGQYVAMATERLRPDFKTERLRAEYKKQAMLGDMIYPVAYKTEGYAALSLNNSDNEAYAVVEFKCLNREKTEN